MFIETILVFLVCQLVLIAFFLGILKLNMDDDEEAPPGSGVSIVAVASIIALLPTMAVVFSQLM